MLGLTDHQPETIMVAASVGKNQMSSVLEDLLKKLDIANKSLDRAQRLTAERAASRETIKTAVQLKEALETVIRLSDQYCAELERQSKK